MLVRINMRKHLNGSRKIYIPVIATARTTIVQLSSGNVLPAPRGSEVACPISLQEPASSAARSSWTFSHVHCPTHSTPYSQSPACRERYGAFSARHIAGRIRHALRRNPRTLYGLIAPYLDKTRLPTDASATIRGNLLDIRAHLQSFRRWPRG